MKRIDWFVIVWLVIGLIILALDVLYNSNNFVSYLTGSLIIELLNLFGYDENDNTKPHEKKQRKDRKRF